MNLHPLLAAATLYAAASLSNAATPTHLYLMDDASDVNGGPALSANGGSFGGGVYSFGANQGLSLTGAVSEAVYTIDFVVALDEVSGYRRLVDFKALGSDTGLYNLESSLNFYNLQTGPVVFGAGETARVTITRDSSALFTGYVNGVAQLSFTDSGDLARFTAPDQLAWFFQDDVSVGGEASAGRVDYIRIFDVALSAAEVAALSPVPEPGSWLLMLGGLATLASAARRRRGEPVA